MKSRAITALRPTKLKQAVFSKQDWVSQNTRNSKQSKCQEFHLITEKNIFLKDFLIGNNWACRGKQSHPKFGTEQKSLTRKQKTTRWLKKTIWIRSRGQGHNEQDREGIQIGQNLWPDHSQTAIVRVGDVIIVIKGCRSATHLYTDTIKRTKFLIWTEYFEWVLQLFLGFVKQIPFWIYDFGTILMNLIQV